MGNICRSPSAKGFFDLHCKKRGLDAHYNSESAGTHGWHTGQPPDPRSIGAATGWDVDISDDISRRVNLEDFENFDFIVAMDRSNLDELRLQNPGSANAELGLLLSFSDKTRGPDVPDPYYGGAGGFDEVCALLNDACSDFLDHLEILRNNKPAS